MKQNALSRFWNLYVLRGWRPFLWLAVGVFLIYGKTLAFKLTNFDDDILLGENLWTIRDIGHFFYAFTRDVFMQSPYQAVYYRPVLTLSFMLDARLLGLSLFSFHLTNILLHIAASLLVFAVLQRLSVSRGRAFLLAALFAAHPALSQAVAWIPGRNDSLLAVFLLASFYAFTRYLEDFRLRDILLHFLFFALAVFTKETALGFVPLFVLYQALFRGKDVNGKRTAPLIAGWALILFSWVAMRNFVAHLPSQPLLWKTTAVSFLEKPGVLLRYVGKAVFPCNLSGFPIAQDTTLLYGIAAVLALAAAIAVQKKEARRLSWFGLAWFFVVLLPLFLVQEKVWLEHRLYLPVVGLLLVFAGIDGFARLRRTAAFGCVAVISLFAGMAFAHSDIFMNRITFWENAAHTSPHSFRARGMLALQYLNAGKYDLSERELIASLRLEPGDTSTHGNYGILLTETGQWARAEQEFITALRCFPGNWAAYYHYGMLFYLQGRDGEAEACWRKAVEINPDYKLGYKTLACFYSLAGDKVRADQFRSALLRKFNYPLNLPRDSVMKDRKWFYSYGKYL